MYYVTTYCGTCFKLCNVVACGKSAVEGKNDGFLVEFFDPFKTLHFINVRSRCTCNYTPIIIILTFNFIDSIRIQSVVHWVDLKYYK